MDKLPYYCHSFVLQASFKTSRTESKNSLTNHEIRQGVFLFSQGESEGDDKMKKAHKHNVYRLSSLQFAYQRRERLLTEPSAINARSSTRRKEANCLVQ